MPGAPLLAFEKWPAENRIRALWPGAPLLAFEKWPAENRNCAFWRQHRGPLLKKREKWRTPSCLVPPIKGNPRWTPHIDVAHPSYSLHAFSISALVSGFKHSDMSS
jgi:hypothetical protein